MSNKKMVLTGVLVLVLVGAVIFGVVAWKGKEKAEEMAPAPVSFTVVAEGWSQETSSPIPIQVTGETEDKEKVDEKYFLGASDKDFTLKPGTYEVEVYASPVNADGGMYRCPKAARLSVPKATAGKSQSKPSASESESVDSGSVVSAEFELSPIPANEITDEDIEKAQSAMKDAGLDEAKIKTFTDSARTARQTELDSIKAKEEAERIAKEREALGMYPGAGGPRPANAKLMEGLSIDVTQNADFDSTGYSDIHCMDNMGGAGLFCLVLEWEKTKGGGEVYYGGNKDFERPAGMYPANHVNFDANGNSSLEYENVTGLAPGFHRAKPGEVWYYGDHVFGVTNSGLTYWNSRTGKGAFISENAYVPF